MITFKTAVMIYIIIISIAGFILPISDKKRAKSGAWRIKERTLFAVALLGGSAAMYASMKIFRHKTKHKRFMLGLPCIIVLQVMAVVFAVKYVGFC